MSFVCYFKIKSGQSIRWEGLVKKVALSSLYWTRRTYNSQLEFFEPHDTTELGSMSSLLDREKIASRKFMSKSSFIILDRISRKSKA